MVFSDTDGAMVADRIMTEGEDKTRHVKKVYQFGNKYVRSLIGAGGQANLCIETARLIEGFETAKSGKRKDEVLKDRDEFAQRIGISGAIVSHSFLNGYCIAQYGIQFDDIIEGSYIDKQGTKRQVPEWMVEDVRDLIKGEESQKYAGLRRLQLLILAQDKKGMGLVITHPGENTMPFQIPVRYDAIGTGGPAALRVIKEHLDRISGEDLATMEFDRNTGLAMLIQAVDQATIEKTGVEGTPDIYTLSAGGPKVTLENNALIATKIVRGWDEGIVTDDLCATAVGALVYEDGDWRQVLHLVKRALDVPRRRALEDLLLGIK